MASRRRVPIATYRLQFNRHFTFKDATEIIPYLQKLGVSDIYSSPFFRSRPDSDHGYDVTNHNELNLRIGTREEPLRGDCGRLIFGAKTQDTTDERLERIASVRRDETDYWRVPRRRLAPEDRERATHSSRIERRAPRRLSFPGRCHVSLI